MNEQTEKILSRYKNQIPVPIVKIANELGIEIYETSDFNDDQSGSIENDNGKFTIFVNANHPTTRKKFTIAHELAHFLEHQEYFKIKNEHISLSRQPVPIVMNMKADCQDEKMEIEANLLAYELLMPKDIFITEWNKATRVSDVAEIFGVSQSAAAFRGASLCQSMII